MPDPNGVNRILPANATVMGQNIDVIADVDPDKFPKGLELTFSVPGDLAPLGRGVVVPGCMVAVVPAEMARAIRSAIRHAARPAGPGEVKAPGL